MPLYQYRCDEHGEFENISTINQHAQAICPKCNTTCRQIITGSNFKLDGTDPGFPTAYEKWARIHESQGKSQCRTT